SWNGSGWNIQTVAMGTDVYSLLLDVNGKPHILYQYRHVPHLGGPLNELMYASWTGRKWGIQYTGIIEANSATLALDSLGKPHIAYISEDAVKYARWTGTNWAIETVDTSIDLQEVFRFRLYFALGLNNKPYIIYTASSYFDYSQGVSIRAINVTLATYQNSSWKIQPLPLLPPIGDIGNLVVDSKGSPHFTFTRHHFVSSENKTILSTILYASWNGTSWNMQTVVSNVYLSRIGFLALDSNNYPHISYSAGESMYASWTGTAWDIQPADLDGRLVIDANGKPHIANYVETGRFISHLMYATATEATQGYSSTFTFSVAVAIITAVIIGTVVTFIYIWKKKPKSHA
ncbi:MAG: hypothetical protein QXD70_06005, partial [Candidatus Bathyarchaeia archaeon]